MVGRVMVVALLALGLAACSTGAATPSAGSDAPVGAETGAPGSPAPSSVDAGAIGRAYVDTIARGDLAAAEAMEDDTMRRAAPAAALGQLWDQITSQFGAYGSIGDVTTQAATPYTTATVIVQFGKATVPLLVAVDGEGRVAGLHLGEPAAAGSPPPSGAASPAPSSSPAAYVRADAFTETEVTVGSAPWALPGTLSMPKGEGPFPAIALVAGSGPQDRDETYGPNKPLRDLAWGLASNGIAVVRYEKRTKAHGAEMAADTGSITVREETVDDAIAAVDLLRGTTGVDPARVFVAGHSLGGYLAPRIAAGAAGRVAGIAMLEANSSPLGQLVLYQVGYLASLESSPSPEASDQLATLRAQVGLAESPGLSTSTPATELPLRIPAAYWLDLRTYDHLGTAAALTIPIFISQGGRDYQVPPSELTAWRTALADRPDVTVREYPALNHLLMAGTGPSTPAEYDVPGHVAPELVADLAAWIRTVGD